jgi:UDPglucose 6-dehydrogenase
VEMSLVREVIQANQRQPARIVAKMEKELGPLAGRTIAVLGLAYKAQTDDVRDSPAIRLVQDLLGAGALIQAHDPQAMANFRLLYPREVQLCESEFEALRDADAAVLCTEWNEYRNIDLSRMKSQMRGRLIVDARNLLDPRKAREAGFSYQGIGR